MSMQSNAIYTIGLDFGSLSCRGVLVDVKDGAILAEAAMAYPHAVITKALPDGTPLNGSWCLQHPDDFTAAMETVIRALMAQSGVPQTSVVGIGIDCTASTVMPVDGSFRPLCKSAAFSFRPHAWPKMWKHHGAADQAEALTRVSREQNRPYLDWYGGKINPECLIAKVIETYQCDREVYDAAESFIEMADYLTSLLCGKPCYSTSVAQAKAFWSPETGYPDDAFFTAVDPALAGLPLKLMERYPDRSVARPGEKVGELCPAWAEHLGLEPGTAVSAAQLDGYTPMLSLGIAREAEMMMIIGTSTGIMLLSREGKAVEGVTACLPGTYYPGFWGYASGQASVGDCFDWFVRNCVHSAADDGGNPHIRLMQEASRLSVGESGLIALDWVNGNKSVLGNSKLSGMFLGIHMGTTDAHMYRALLEATAFGARRIVEAFRSAGVAIEKIRACGGVAYKNPLLMQIYADVLGVPISVSRMTQAPAKGMAIYAAAAAGEKAGHSDLFAAVDAMCDRDCISYQPDAARMEAYQALYEEYVTLHDYFGRGVNGVMERMYSRRLAAAQKQEA